MRRRRFLRQAGLAPLAAGLPARRAAAETASLIPPKHIPNAPSSMMKDQGYGAGYKYDHDTAEGFSGQDYFPEGMQRPAFYTPKGEGREKPIAEMLKHWQAIRSFRRDG